MRVLTAQILTPCARAMEAAFDAHPICTESLGSRCVAFLIAGDASGRSNKFVARSSMACSRAMYALATPRAATLLV